MSLTRNTVFAVLMGLENDLRRTARRYVDPSTVLTPDETSRATVRWRADRPRGHLEPSTEELFDYLDLSELLDILDRVAGPIADSLDINRRRYRSLVEPLRSLVPIRNRVCHARPLEPDDFSAVWSLLEAFSSAAPPALSLTDLEDTRLRLHQWPAYPLTLSIPDYWRRDAHETPNNLPVPEYDDTGFIGRKSDREAVLRLLYGAHRVVTITGEGGVGKTSLALQTLYDAAADQAGSFDHIVWVSLKTETLTTTGVRQIADALTTPSDLLQHVAATAGDVPEFDDLAGLIGYVVELLGSFRILLAIDNLETIDRDALRPLFLDLPAESKILITSRYGIGEFETRYALSPMERPDAVRLLRSVARLLNADGLWKRDDAQLAEVCERLFYNPLAIRWFAQSYSEGRSVADLLQRRRSLEEVLNFCFHTLYASLSDEYREYLRILVAVGKPLSEVQLALLAGADSLDQVRASLHYLHSSNLVRRTNDDWATTMASLWTTSDFARAYIVNRDQQIVPERPKIVQRYRALISARDSARVVGYSNPFRSRAIGARTTDEASVVYLLYEALRSASEGDHRAALQTVDKAKQLQPGFYEVWRVSGQVRAAADPIGAQQDFDRALELADGKSQPLLAFVANFMADQDDAAGAVELLHSFVTRKDADPRLLATYARMLGLAGDLSASLEQFALLEPRLADLGGGERAVATTQYAETLRRSAETDLQRELPDQALAKALRGIDLVKAACEGNYVDRVLVREGGDCIAVACRAITRQCSIPSWEALDERLLILREFIPFDARLSAGFDMISLRCPQIAASSSFARIVASSTNQPQYMFGDVLAPGIGREYTFIRADDGQDYFLHQSELLDGPNWAMVGGSGWSRVRFRRGEPRPGKSPPAHAAVVIHLGDE